MIFIKRLLILFAVFILSVGAGFGLNVLFTDNPLKVKWDDSVGHIQTDFAYADGEKNKFDLYLPAQKNKSAYALVVYLHAGGFAIGDKSDDAHILKFFTAKGYVSAGINYSLRSESNATSILQMSNEVKVAVPKVIEKARELGYPIDRMAVMGGSAGGALAMIYAFRDGKQAPVPVKFVFQQVGPPGFDPNDWYNIGSDIQTAAIWVETATGIKTTVEMIENGQYKEILKPISAYEWINENSPPMLCAYGELDKLVPISATEPLFAALNKFNVEHDCFMFKKSGHALHRDRKLSKAMYAKLDEYLAEYLR